MSDDLDYGSDSGDVEYQPSATVDVAEPAPYQPAFKPEDYAIPDRDQPVPTFIPNGVDAKTAQITRQQQSLARQKPVYTMDDGSFSDRYIPPTGTRIMMGQEATYSGGTQAFTYQQQQIQELEKQKPKFSDAMIMDQGGKIAQDLLATSPTGKLDSKGFFENPYWDTLRATGTSEDTIRRVQNTTLHAIKAPLKQMEAQKAYGQLVQDSIVDNPYAPDFLQSRGTDPTGQPVPNMLEHILKTQPGSPVAKKILKMFQDRQIDLDDNPEHLDEYNRLKESQSPDDKATLDRLLGTKTAGAFSNFLNSTIKNTVRLDEKHAAMISSQNQALDGLSGESVESFRDGMSKMTNQKVFDKGQEFLAPAWIKYAKENMGDENGMVTVKYKGQDMQIPSLYESVHEKKILDESKRLEEGGVSRSEQLIGMTANGTPTIIHGAAKDKFIHTDIENAFGKTGLKDDGQYVKIPGDMLRDQAGNDVFLNIPPVQGVKGPMAETTYTYKSDQYVDRAALKKIGLSEEMIKQSMKTGDSITVDPKYNSWLKGQAKEYEPTVMTMDQFMDDEAIKRLVQVNSADGHRLSADDQFIQQMKMRNINASANAKDNMAWTEIPKEDPTFVSETAKGFGRGLVSIATDLWSVGMGVGESIQNLVKGIAAKSGGDDAQAAKYFANLNPIKEISVAHQAVDEAREGGWLNLDKLNSDPRATWQQKTGAFVGELAGSLVTMTGEIKLIDEATQLPRLMAKLTDFGTTIAGYDSQIMKLTTAAKIAGASQEAIDMLNVQRKVLAIGKTAADFVALGLFHGESDPTKLAQEAAVGAATGGAGQIGRGISMKSWLPSGSRLAAGAGVGGLIVGMDSLRLMNEGKSPEELKAQMKDPEYWAHVATMMAFPVFGNHALAEVAKVAPEGTTGAKKGIPDALKMEGFLPHKATTQELIDFANAHKDNHQEFTASENEKFGDVMTRLQAVMEAPAGTAKSETIKAIIDLWNHEVANKYDPAGAVKVQESGISTTKEKMANVVRTAQKVENGTATEGEVAKAKVDQAMVEGSDAGINDALKAFKGQVGEVERSRTSPNNPSTEVGKKSDAEAEALNEGLDVHEKMMGDRFKGRTGETPPVKRSYESVQSDIDAFEARQEKQGVNVTKQFDPSDKYLVDLGKNGWTPMPKELAKLYAERDDIGSAQLQTNIKDIQGILKGIGLSQAEQTRILGEYSLNSERTDASSQYLAAEFSKKAAKEPLNKKAEKIAYGLAAERGEHFDELRDISKKTLEDAAKAAKAIQEYFHGTKEASAPKPTIGKMTVKGKAAKETAPPQQSGKVDVLDAYKKAVETIKAKKPVGAPAKEKKAGSFQKEEDFNRDERSKNLPKMTVIRTNKDGLKQIDFKIGTKTVDKFVHPDPKASDVDVTSAADEYRKTKTGEVSADHPEAGVVIKDQGLQPDHGAMANEDKEIYQAHVDNLMPHVQKGVSFDKLIGSSMNEFEGDQIKAAGAVIDAITNHAEALYNASGKLSDVNKALKAMEVPSEVQDQIRANLEETSGSAANQKDAQEKDSKAEEGKNIDCPWTSTL